MRHHNSANLAAALYILSGICQPLLVTVCYNAGLADPKAQLYMLFYYAGPACLIFTLCFDDSRKHGRLALSTIWKAAGIACFDIFAQSLNYTGASWAGATIFSIIYSSVTVWTALFSLLFLKRRVTNIQWCAIALVFLGLCITALDSAQLGERVSQGTTLVLAGSCMHGATYVLSEAIMKNTSSTSSNNVNRTALTVRENAAIQGSVACGGMLIWQLLYTRSRWGELIHQPMEKAGTSLSTAFLIFFALAAANLLHSVTFYHTIAHYPGGSTSAGIMKGLQAVLVFVVAHLLYCKLDADMCFSTSKFLSLCTVVGGVIVFNSEQHRSQEYIVLQDTPGQNAVAV